jgi:hypothetical protein
MADEIALKAQVVKRRPARRELTPSEQQKARLKNLENKLLQDSMEVVTGVCEFAEIEPNQEGGCPQAWIDELGEATAMKKWRLTNAGWLNSKDAPVGITVATKISIGILRAHAASKAPPVNLNIAKIEMTVAQTEYDVIDLEE